MKTAFEIVVAVAGLGGFVAGLWLTMKLEPPLGAGIPRWRVVLGYLLPFIGATLCAVTTYELLLWLG